MSAIKRRDTSKKRNTILDAAIECFIELGYERTSMDYIAERACASKRTVYNHFASKELLFNAVIARFIVANEEQKQIDYQPATSLAVQLRQFAQLKIAVSQDAKQLSFMRMAFGVLLTHPEIAERVMQNTDKSEDGLHNWLQAAVDDGKLLINDIALAAEVFWSMFSSTFFWMALLQGPQEKARCELLTQEFLETFLAKYQVV
ncbi:TetR/AcrR family transcriptional regulator [Thalassotalea euphylliae]|uniref:TetR/AcrR family transcriptional regulator n=1 Tax=Thalassotalea euphylliae TaxID=1655234 RepID=A0A3E0U6V1_9GAMM|nr:TetR/AcrR family transcriptional regulator [Thalassotalea euphylliae]REL32539.1 TetR/AcrR family transcriptional regulator [Thalassotalea euphylliae]